MIGEGLTATRAQGLSTASPPSAPASAIGLVFASAIEAMARQPETAATDPDDDVPGLRPDRGARPDRFRPRVHPLVDRS